MRYDTTSERVVYQQHPAMFRNHPVYYMLCLFLSLVGIGLVLFLAWWIRSRSITLTITNRRIILREGFLAKHTNAVYHVHVNNIRVNQSFMQRMMGVGGVEILTGGHAGVEITVAGIRNPITVKMLVDKYRLPAQEGAATAQTPIPAQVNPA